MELRENYGMKQLTAERLRELLNYDPKTGVFTWRVNKGMRARAGSAVTHTRTDGYMSVKIDGHHHRGTLGYSTRPKRRMPSILR
jgi:hypothetical protein